MLLSFDTTPGPLQRRRRDPFVAMYETLNRRRPAGAERNSFTLFIVSGGLQLDPARRWRGAALPFVGSLPRNRPVIGYARDLRYLRAKVASIRALHAAGVEIASHGVRHEHGAGWELARWHEEVRDHARILALFDLPRPLGFRAPFLEAGPHAYAAHAAVGARYDAGCASGSSWPSRDPATGIWCFPIPTVHLAGHESPSGVLFFDDNVRTVLGRLARERGLRGGAAERFMDAAYFDAAMDAFERRYRGNRAPFLVSGHGTMRSAALRFMRHVCELPQVRCATMREALAYLEAHPELEGEPPVHGQIVRATLRTDARWRLVRPRASAR